MLIYKTDKIVEGTDGAKTVYSKLVDDAKPDVALTNLCVTYKSEVDFEAELQRKTEKFLATIASKASIEPSVAAVYKRIEAKMDSLKQAATEVSQEKEITP